jgi:2-methylcitrate dehydratase PrpD
MDDRQKNLIYDSMAACILNTRFEDIDQATVDNTKTRIFDTIGDAIGGAPLPDIAYLVKMVTSCGGKGEASIIGYGIKAPVQDAAFINCTMSRSFDRGPLSYYLKDKIVPHHVSETTVLTALALGENKGISGKELITALVVGDDIAARLHLANDRALPGEFHKGQENAPNPFPQTGIQSPTYGAAAIAGRLLKLTAVQMKNTLGLVGNSEGFGGGIWDGAPTFKISQGTMARGGIMAAQLALGGWTGSADPFFNERGGPFARRLDHPEILSGDLGKKFYVENMFKRYPGGGPTQAPNHAAIALVHKYHIQAEDIEEVILRTSPGVATGLHYARPYKVGDYPTGDALFSYKYGIASALLRGAAGNKEYSEAAVRDPKVQALIKKVKLALAELPRSEGVELAVRMKDGRELSEYVAQAQGIPPQPLPREVLVKKFMDQVEFAQMVSRENGEEIIKLVDNLENVTNVKKIVELATQHDII